MNQSAPTRSIAPIVTRPLRPSTLSPTLRFLLFGLFALSPSCWAAQSVHHALSVRLDPGRGQIAVEDGLTLPTEDKEWILTLHDHMEPRVTAGEAALVSLGRRGNLERFRLTLQAPGTPVTLAYAGRIEHGLDRASESPGRTREWTQGIISGEGVFLDGASGWYPAFEGLFHTFEMRVALPAGWLAVSQGVGPYTETGPEGVTVHWREDQPQDEIYLIAGAFRFYEEPTPIATAQAYLREPDDALAQRYLDATARYLKLYSELIGFYPYAKFALVENFWATGYGMPSFTLLGAEVIRLPFIPYTSYPHEVLHNWWGNGVYVDYETGNWSEGITSYLADHLLKEEAGQGAAYRRDSLQGYASYVREEKDFPLTVFRGRHSAASQAVGYGKSMMLFHMVRRDLGDETFVAGLRRFYQDNRFRAAGFDDIRRAFEQASGKDLAPFFRQWTERTGAPALALVDVTVAPVDSGFRVTGQIRQTQDADPFSLNVPLVVRLKDQPPTETRVSMTGRRADFVVDVPTEPLRVAVDPRFDLFRALVPGESPPTLSQLFGADKGLILLPSAASPALQGAYRALAETWSRGYKGWKLISDADLKALPADRPVWILGWENRFLNELTGPNAPFKLDIEGRILELAEGQFQGADLSTTLVVPREGKPPLAWLAVQAPEPLPGLTRKLPHYGKYCYLVFAGQAPDNRIKGQWPVSESALMVRLGEPGARTDLPPETPLTQILD